MAEIRNILNEPSASDLKRMLIAQESRNDIASRKGTRVPINVAPAVGKKSLVYKSSTLLNAGGTDLAGRKLIRVTNLSCCTVLITFKANNAEIAEEGEELRAGEYVEYSFEGETGSVPVYGRALGFDLDNGDVFVEVMEC